MRRINSRRVVLAAVFLIAALTGCEGAIEHNIRNIHAADAPEVDTHLKTEAQAHSQAQCDSGTVFATEDPDAAYGPDSFEWVGRAVLDPELDDRKANHEATSQVWRSWRGDPVLRGGAWDVMAAGETTCADGHLYMTLVLQGDPAPDPDPDPDDTWASGVVRVTAGNAPTQFGGISTDGSRVAILSEATDLLDGGNAPDILLYDTTTGGLEPTGLEPVQDSGATIALAGNGRHLVYADLVEYPSGLPAESQDLFVWDNVDDTTIRITTDFRPHAAASISDDGSVVTSIRYGADHSVMVHEVGGASTEWHWGVIGGSHISLSSTGRYVAGSSFGFTEVLDRDTGTTAPVATDCFPIDNSTTGGGSALSFDGRHFAYTCWDQPSHADDDGQVDLFVWDRTTNSSELVTEGDDGLGMLSTASISDDGRFVAYAYERPASTSGAGTYLLDRTTGESTLVAPVAPSAVAVSGDGGTVAFTAAAPDQSDPSVEDLFVWTNPAV